MKNTRYKLGIILALIMGCLCSHMYAWNEPKVEDTSAEGTEVGNGETKVVKVGYFHSVPQNGLQIEEPRSGYAYQFMSTVSYFTNWKYEYVYGRFDELYEKLLTGEVDAMAGLTKTHETDPGIIFPSDPMGTKSYYIYTKSHNEEVNTDPNSLKGKRVGVVDGKNMDNVLQRWCVGRVVEFTIERYKTFTELLVAFDAGEVDCIVAYSNDSSVLKDVKPIVKLDETPYYFAFSKNRKDLLMDFNRAFGLLNELDPNFVQDLQLTYDNTYIVNTKLSKKERAWLERHPVTRVGYLEKYLPFCDKDDNGKVTGVLTNVMAEMGKYIESVKVPDMDFKGYEDYEDMVKALNEGEVDMVFPVASDAWIAEQEGLYVTKPVVSTTMVLVFRYEVTANTNKRMAVNRNNQMQLHYTQKQYPNAEIVMYNSIRECLDAVKKGDANSTILNGTRVNAYINNARYGELSYATLITKSDRCFAVRQGNDSLLVLLERGLKLIGRDYGMNALQLYTKAEYSLIDYIRQNAINLMLVGVSIFGLVLWILSRQKHKKERLLNEIEKRNKELVEANEKAEYANSAKTKFLNSMSHDIRTPMNAIIGFTNLAGQHLEEPDTLSNYLSKINVSSHHLLALINEILDMSRIESGKSTLNEEATSLKDLMKKIRIITEDGAKQKSIEIDFSSIQIQDNMVEVDNMRLTQVLINIIGNAIKYTEDGGLIKVSLRQMEGTEEEGKAMYEFRVKDNGIGMSEEYQKHIFEAFTRERSASVTRIQGSGLGMAITKRIVKMMNGSIEVESKEGIGSEFTVRIPLQVLHDATPVKEQTSTLATPPQARLTGKRVLLVEDNELNSEIAMAILETMDMKVETAENGKEAVEMVEQHEAHYYDAILMDIQMPVMDGYEATRMIRAMEDADKRNIPIIATTADAFEEDKKKAYETGMNAHISKPIAPEQLAEELSKMVK